MGTARTRSSTGLRLLDAQTRVVLTGTPYHQDHLRWYAPAVGGPPSQVEVELLPAPIWSERAGRLVGARGPDRRPTGRRADPAGGRLVSAAPGAACRPDTAPGPRRTWSSASTACSRWSSTSRWPTTGHDCRPSWRSAQPADAPTASGCRSGWASRPRPCCWRWWPAWPWTGSCRNDPVTATPAADTRLALAAQAPSPARAGADRADAGPGDRARSPPWPRLRRPGPRPSRTKTRPKTVAKRVTAVSKPKPKPKPTATSSRSTSKPKPTTREPEPTEEPSKEPTKDPTKKPTKEPTKDPKPDPEPDEDPTGRRTSPSEGED